MKGLPGIEKNFAGDAFFYSAYLDGTKKATPVHSGWLLEHSGIAPGSFLSFQDFLIALGVVEDTYSSGNVRVVVK